MSLEVSVVCPYSFTKAHSNDACYDICSNQNLDIMPGQTRIVKTGLYLCISDGWYGQIYTRSRLASRGITTMGGVIDSGYRGEVGVILHNSSDQIYTIILGDRIAQIAFHQVPQVEINMVDSVDQFPESTRGQGGFGSTGN